MKKIENIREMEDDERNRRNIIYIMNRKVKNNRDKRDIIYLIDRKMRDRKNKKNKKNKR